MLVRLIYLKDRRIENVRNVGRVKRVAVVERVGMGTGYWRLATDHWPLAPCFSFTTLFCS
jgi:hypothetical protein